LRFNFQVTTLAIHRVSATGTPVDLHRDPTQKKARVDQRYSHANNPNPRVKTERPLYATKANILVLKTYRSQNLAFIVISSCSIDLRSAQGQCDFRDREGHQNKLVPNRRVSEDSKRVQLRRSCCSFEQENRQLLASSSNAFANLEEAELHLTEKGTLLFAERGPETSRKREAGKV
jgi:hypothetical protein